MLEINEAAKRQLELLIDTFGLAEVLCGVAQVCNEKAEHLEGNWQDRASAKLWTRAGTRVSHTVATAAIGDVSP